MNSNARKSRRLGQRGIVLLIVLVVVAVISLGAYTFSELMLTHHKSAQLGGRQLQARLLVESGVEAIRMFLLQDQETQAEAGGYFDNPDYFMAIPVLSGDDPASRGNFTVVAPFLDETGNLAGVRYGLENDSTRLNLNALLLADQAVENGGRELLMGLPGMDESIADAILDWIDEDDEPRENGAETSDYYAELDPPYAAKNGPLDTVEELLLVRGVTPQMLFGLDANRNGIVDPHEYAPGGTTLGTADPSIDLTDTTDGSLERGWSGYLTLYSMEKNVNDNGDQRVYLNNENMEQLHSDLSAVFNAEWANFIVAYRQNGPYDGSESGENAAGGELDLSQPATVPLVQVLDLIGKKVEVQFAGGNETTVLSSPFSEDMLAMGQYMPTLMNNCSINPSPSIPGRININEASRTTMLGIPGMTEEIVDQIIEQRAVESEDEQVLANLRHETWLLTSGIVTLDEMRSLVPFISAGGSVLRAQVVGYFEDGTTSSRAEVIFDATGDAPRILSWRDLGHLGRGYPLEILGVQFGTEGMVPVQ